jgi:lysyl-tRNA synthetase class 2
LNNPFDQRLRFEEQARQKDQGDDEAYVDIYLGERS